MAEEFKNYLNKFIYSDLTDITSNAINSYIGGLKLKILIYLLNQKKSKNIASEFDRVNPRFKCIKEHILKYCIVISQNRTKIYTI